MSQVEIFDMSKLPSVKHEEAVSNKLYLAVDKSFPDRKEVLLKSHPCIPSRDFDLYGPLEIIAPKPRPQLPVPKPVKVFLYKRLVDHPHDKSVGAGDMKWCTRQDGYAEHVQPVNAEMTKDGAMWDLSSCQLIDEANV